ncbi:histidine-specific methyltransferase [Xylariaceae sp. FL1651]|nr:histidine-specific methyltransferase [Xylariaceae sp. FL1651]
MSLYQPAFEEGTVVDVGGSMLPSKLRGLVEKWLCPTELSETPILHSALMWDDVGLGLFRKITCNPAYNQMTDELALMRHHLKSISETVCDGVIIIDLGSGDFKKLKLLLSALSDERKRVVYYAVDLSKESLVDNLAQFYKQGYPNMRAYGLWGTFDDAHAWLSQFHSDQWHPRYFCSLGSQLGNDYYSETVRVWRKWATLFDKNDRFLVGLDSTSNIQRLWDSYHDADGLFETYIRNGFKNSNYVLGTKWYKHEEWDISGEVTHNPTIHRFVLTARKDVEIHSLDPSSSKASVKKFAKGDRIHCYESFKYSQETVLRQFAESAYDVRSIWSSMDGTYHQYLLMVREDSG